ncbi:MAG: accessory factor UbiK family protein [Cycloclasticus sp.]|nr:accessory factor UbiK family protein [Cycloclasticus sp.]
MINTHIIEEIVASLTSQLPPGLSDLKEETENNVKAILQQQFTKLDLVTREEFDVQSAVLARTRAKLEALEKTIAGLSVAKK